MKHVLTPAEVVEVWQTMQLQASHPITHEAVRAAVAELLVKLDRPDAAETWRENAGW